MFHLSEPSSLGKTLRVRPHLDRLEGREVPGSTLDLFSPTANLGGIGLALPDPALSSPPAARSHLTPAASPAPANPAGGVETHGPGGSVASAVGTALLAPAAPPGLAGAGWLNFIPPGSGAGITGSGTFENPLNGPFDDAALPACDDCSSTAVSLGFTFNFFGVQRNTVWINNNGNITFNSAFGSFTPGPLTEVGQPILAPFWADVITSDPGQGVVTYGRGTLDGDPAFGVTWTDVTPYFRSSPFNTFQVVIADHSARLGYQEVQFNYLNIRWDDTDSAGGRGPRVGYANGAGQSGEVPGSGTLGTLTDGGVNSLRDVRRYTLIVYPS